jgi:hypothetical protein
VGSFDVLTISALENKMIPEGLEVLSYRFSGGANLQGISKPATFSFPLFDSTEVILDAERKAR